MSESYSVTSAGVNPADDRAHRERMYYMAMSLRVLCVVSLFWVRGWGVFVALAGAVILPWFAVMVGNAVAHSGGTSPDAPEPVAIEGGETAADAGPAAADEVIVVDVDPERRSSSRESPGLPGGGSE